ncbi:outer membrane protein assembly factor BamB family protein [Cellulomonas soli]
MTATPDVTLDPTWTSPTDVPDTSVTVARYDWGSSTPRWTFRTPPVAHVFDRSWLFGNAGQVIVGAGSTTWLLGADDGTSVGSLTGPEGYGLSAETIPGGGMLTASYAGESLSSQMLTADGTVVDLPGLLPVTRTVDDDSAADLLLLAEMTANWEPGSLVAVDARTGERRWSSTASAQWSAVVLGGVVYAASGRTLAAVDADDGAVLWTRSLDHSDGQLLTDGAAALLIGQGRVDAFDLRDGTPLWSSLLVSTDGTVGLQPQTDGPTASATATPVGADESWLTMVGRHLAVMFPTGDLSVLG